MVNPTDNEATDSATGASAADTVQKPTESSEDVAAVAHEADEADPDTDQRQALLNNDSDGGQHDRGDEIELNEVARVPEVQIAGGGANGDLEAGGGGGDTDASKKTPLVIVVDGGATKSKQSAASDSAAQFAGLTKEELEKFAKDPFWRRLRLILFVLFWIVWLAMFAAVIIIIVLSPKCPPRQTRQFWQRPFYRLEVVSFAPDPAAAPTPSRAGSLAGLADRVDYIRRLGINNFLLDSLVRPSPTSGCPLDFSTIDESLGTLEQLRALTKRGRRKGFQLMMELDVSQADPSWKLAEAGADPFVRERISFDRMLSRDGKPAWAGQQLRVPRSQCASLNVSSERVRQALFNAMSAWLDAGLSGFSLTNAAFLLPKKTNQIPDRTPPVGSNRTLAWYTKDPRSSLNSPEAADFTRSVRAFLDSEAVRLGRELALFVDFGDVAYPMPYVNISGRFGAHAVIHTGLGQPILPATEPEAGLRAVVEAALTAANTPGVGNFAWASNWPYLRRDASPALAVLGLTLPGLGLVYYGQELGMSHVPGYRLSRNYTSYLEGADSTDQARSPMQWTGDASNAGWLPDSGVGLAWAGDLSVRAADILSSNLRRLDSSGHPQSNLQLTEQLVAMATSLESLQWGQTALIPNLPSDPNLIGFTRKAVRFPAVLVLINSAERAFTVDPTGAAVGNSGVLKLLHSWGGGASSSHTVGKRSKFGQVFVPPRTALVFVLDE